MVISNNYWGSGGGGMTRTKGVHVYNTRELVPGPERQKQLHGEADMHFHRLLLGAGSVQRAGRRRHTPASVCKRQSRKEGNKQKAQCGFFFFF